MPRSIDQLRRYGIISDESLQRIAPQADSSDQQSSATAEDPLKVLSTFQGDHNGALVWGEKNHRDAYVNVYGPEKALNLINGVLESDKALKGQPTGGGEWYKELEDYRDELLARQGY